MQYCVLCCPGWPQNKIERKQQKKKSSIWILLGNWKKLCDIKVTIQITTLLRSARIPRRVLEIWGDLLSKWFQWETLLYSAEWKAVFVSLVWLNLGFPRPLANTLRIQTIQFSISIAFVCTQLHSKIVLFQTVQFSVSTVSMPKQFYFKRFSLA